MNRIQQRITALERRLCGNTSGLVITEYAVERARLELAVWRAEQSTRIGIDYDISEVASVVESRLDMFARQ